MKFVEGLPGGNTSNPQEQDQPPEPNKVIGGDDGIGGRGDGDGDMFMQVSIKLEDSPLTAKRKVSISQNFSKGGSRVLPSVGWQPPEGKATGGGHYSVESGLISG